MVDQFTYHTNLTLVNMKYVDQFTYHTNLTLVNMKYGGSDYIPYKFNIGKHEIWWISLYTIQI